MTQTRPAKTLAVRESHRSVHTLNTRKISMLMSHSSSSLVGRMGSILRLNRSGPLRSGPLDNEEAKDTRNEKLMRSYVMFKYEFPSSGANEELVHEEHEIFSGGAVFNMKRLVGRMDTDPVVHASKTLPFMVQTLDIGVRPFIAALVKNVWRSTTPEEVLAIFLVELNDMAKVQLKRPVRNLVLTVPVSFSRFQQTRIEHSCAMAGLHVLRLMPEPTSVALLHAQQQLQSVQSVPDGMGSGSEKVALIFNMGAGYCDVAVIATAGGVSQIKALLGCAVGGEDILENVMGHVVPKFDSLCSYHSSEMIKSRRLLRSVTLDAIHKLTEQKRRRTAFYILKGSLCERGHLPRLIRLIS